MITVNATQNFEARVEGFPTGLVGSVGVRILDNIGGIAVGRTTSGIIEDPIGSGSYVTTLLAPAVAGQYTVFWDRSVTPTPSTTAAEDLIVVGTVREHVVESLPGKAPAGMIPHLDLPFRYSFSGKPSMVEQDSYEDIDNCIEAILRTQPGQRLEITDFGVPDLTFSMAPIKESDLIGRFLTYEPRASVSLEQIIDRYDALHTTINTNVSRAKG